MILMLFHLFCMFDDHWGMELRSLNYVGSSRYNICETQKTKRNTGDLFFHWIMKEAKRGAWGGDLPARLPSQPREQVMWPPWPTTWRTPLHTSSPRRPRIITLDKNHLRRHHEVEKTEREKLSGRLRCRWGNSLPKGGNRRHHHRHRASLHWDHHHHHLHRRHRHLHWSTSFPLYHLGLNLVYLLGETLPMLITLVIDAIE